MSYQVVGKRADVFGGSGIRPLSLAESLAAIGIKAIPQSRVNAHKLKANKNQSRVVRFVYLVFFVAGLQMIPTALARMGTKLSTAIAQVVTMLLEMLLAVAILEFHQGSHFNPWYLLVATPVAGTMLAILWTDVVGSKGFAWERARINSDGESSELLPAMPQGLKVRARVASDLPGVRLIVEFLNTDPILYAARGYFWRREMVPIGAWVTGDSFLDSF